MTSPHLTQLYLGRRVAAAQLAYGHQESAGLHCWAAVLNGPLQRGRQPWQPLYS